MKTYAIGDIHGCLDELNELIDKIMNKNPDKVIFLGDYVDRGPDSRGVIERLIQFKKEFDGAIFIKGNHDAIMFSALTSYIDRQFWLQIGGDVVIEQYETYPDIPEEHYNFLKNLKYFYDDGTHLFVHAGIPCEKSFDIKNPSKDDLETMMWAREDFLPYEHALDRIVVHGHSISKEPRMFLRKIGVDTGCYANGTLTALEIDGDSYDFIQTKREKVSKFKIK